MSIKTKIEDGEGSGYLAKVSSEGFLYVQEAPFPPANEETKITVYREYLTLNGDGSTFDMRVDGSTSSQYFWIESEPDYDIYITSISFIISDVGAALNEFGALPALTQGCRLFYEDENGEINVGVNLTSNWEFVRLCLGEPSFGSGADVFRGQNIVGASEGYIPTLDFKNFGFKWGLKLEANTTNKLLLEINDDLSTIDGFNALAYGFRRKID